MMIKLINIQNVFPHLTSVINLIIAGGVHWLILGYRTPRTFIS